MLLAVAVTCVALGHVRGVYGVPPARVQRDSVARVVDVRQPELQHGLVDAHAATTVPDGMRAEHEVVGVGIVQLGGIEAHRCAGPDRLERLEVARVRDAFP